MKKTNDNYVAYFSMELGLHSSLPTYSGGLGVLAGDTVKAMADIGHPLVAVTMLNEKGYFKQEINKKNEQLEKEDNWTKEKFLKLLPLKVKIKISGRPVWVQVWQYDNKNGLYDKDLEVYYLDTNLKENSDYDRSLTSYLYGLGREYRISQELVLGVGGFKILQKLGYKKIKKYHINEGHAAFLTVELLKNISQGKDKITSGDLDLVRSKCAFTTHTPIAAGHDTFEITLAKKVLDDYLPPVLFKKATDKNGFFNMTKLALNTCSFVNGVAKRHEEKTKNMFPDYEIFSITNGIHSGTWASKHFSSLFKKYLNNWREYPYSLRYAKSIPSQEIWQAHESSKADLFKFLFKTNKIKLKQDVLTIGFARRFTAYKRSDLIFHDLEKLKSLAENSPGLQLIFAGKAHPNDSFGKLMIKKILELQNEINESSQKLKIVFVKNYNMKIAELLVAGCDVWLNNPQRPYEASGTSGMKAALNGIPHLSTMDGWWLEGCIEGVTGWGFGPGPNSTSFDKDLCQKDEAKALYKKLEQVVIPTFYDNKKAWLDIMSNCIAINGSFFNSYRMAQEYINHVY